MTASGRGRTDTRGPVASERSPSTSVRTPLRPDALISARASARHRREPTSGSRHPDGGEVTHPFIALLISFDDGAMNPEKEPPDVGRCVRMVREQGINAGVWVLRRAADRLV